MDRSVPTLVSRLFSTHAAVAACGLALGWLVSSAGAGIGVGVFGGLFFVLLSFKTLRPAILLLVALMMVFGRGELFQYDIPFAGGGLKPSDVLLAVVLLSWAVRVIVFGNTVLKLPRVFCALVLAYMAVAGASALGAITSGVYFKDPLLELRPLLQYLVVFPLMAEFDAAALRRGVWILLGVSVFSSVRILASYWMGVGQVLLYGEGIRVMLLELGAYLPPVILGLSFYLYGMHPRISLTIGLLNLTALAVTFYRSAYLGLSSGMGFMMLVAEPAIKRLMIKLVLIVALGGCILWVGHSVISPKAANPIESVVTRILSLSEYKEDISSLHRLREWEAATALIARSPIWGNGLGTRVVFESPMYDEETQRLGYLSHDMYMHNSYMWLLVKMGAVGLTSFLLLPLTALWTAVRSLRLLADPAMRALQLGMCGVLVGTLVISIFGPMFNVDSMTPINAFILGSVFILAREAQNPWENEI
jgi:O-antigen ligase